MPKLIHPEELARTFHEEYERMAPAFGYSTRKESAVPWDNVPENNRQLMTAVALSVMLKYFPDRLTIDHG